MRNLLECLGESKRLDQVKNAAVTAASIAGMIYLRNPEITNQFLRGNCSDIVNAICFYSGTRFGNDAAKPSAILATGVALGGTLLEFAQKAGILAGTFDWKDIPMYFLGAGLAYGFDKLTYRTAKSKEKDLDLHEGLLEGAK